MPTNTPVAVVGDFVWFDQNANGIQEAGEPGLATVQVTLYHEDGSLVATTITDATGYYRFAGVDPGNYVLVFTTPTQNGEAYAFSPADQGDQLGGGAVDSDAEPSTGQTTVFTITAGQSDLTWDAGFYLPMHIGNLVWHDKNNNGLVDGDESGLPGVTLQLFGEGSDPAGGTPLATTVTDANGIYTFGNLPPGRYFVYLPSPPAGYPVSSTVTDAADNGEDNDNNGAQAVRGGPVGSPIIALLPQGEPTGDGDGTNSDQTIDFGFFALASLGDLVWYDANQDGIQDATETSIAGIATAVGVPGVNVRLYGAESNLLIATLVTDSQGHYTFNELLPGNYYVQIELPPGYQATLPNVDTPNDAFDSDVDPATLNTALIALESGTNNPSIDMGIYLVSAQSPTALGDWVWLDTNGNGLQEPSETGVPGVPVTLYRADGSLVATTTTDATGHYLFTGLAPGDYILAFTPPAGYALTQPGQGDPAISGAVDSDADPATGYTAIINLGTVQTDVTQDAGLITSLQPATLGGLTWLDRNKDGVRDSDETPMSGVEVTLYQADGTLLATLVTDSNGNYLFTNLVPGNYYLVFNMPAGYQSSLANQGGDDTLDSDAIDSPDGLSGQTPIITLNPGESQLFWDNGLQLAASTENPLQLPASIGNLVWFDANANGFQDGGEVGLSDIVVKLYDAAGAILGTDVTDSNGNYLFEGLVAGDYFIEFILPSDYQFSPSMVASGSDPGSELGSDNDSNADPTTGRTGQITLQFGMTDLTWDAGLYQRPTSLEDGMEPGQQRLYLPLVTRRIAEAKAAKKPKVPIIECYGDLCITR